MKRWWLLALALPLALAACGDDGSDDPGTGEQREDAGPADLGGVDSGTAQQDLGTPDAGPEDLGPRDLGPQDLGRDDAGPEDGGAPDQGGAEDAAVDGGVEDAEVDQGTPDAGQPERVLPDSLPFEYARPAAGEPLTDEEITDFTRAVTGLWKDADYFRWVRMTSHGMDPSNEEGMFDYALWWQDTRTSKQGDTVTFSHTGRADNLTLRTSKVLNNLLAGWFMTGDEDMRWTAIQYCKGIVALSKAMEFGEDDPVKYLQARAVFSQDHTYETVGGRLVSIDYGPMRREDVSWNAENIHNPTNPYWGDMWFVNQRSKDDVPHMYRTLHMLRRAAAQEDDAELQAAAALAIEYLEGFARDIVDHEWQIRTKFEDGEAVVPRKDGGVVKDLASFTMYDPLDPLGECNPKLTSALIGYGETRDVDCANGIGPILELFATEGHYFNYAIYRYFHISAVMNAILEGKLEVAQALMAGLAERADDIVHNEALPNRDEAVWMADVAAFLLASGAAGLPLTNEEARIVHEQYLLSVEHYQQFAYWDPWDASVPDGAFDYKPSRGVAVRPTEISYLLEYCYSPLRNPASAPLVDCDIVADPAQWGPAPE